MVTLAERISESVLRRPRRLPGSARTLEVQDATAGKSVHGDNFTRFCPQGSTGIPACEMKYPGDAAQPRPPVLAGFRPVSGASGKLNINGANTYQFGMSNPVGRMDPWETQAEGGGDGGDVDDGSGPPAPPPEGFWQDVMHLFGYGVQGQTGPPDHPLPPGYVWTHPPTIQAPGIPFDPSLWQVMPADPNNPATPPVQTQTPDGKALPFAQQLENARRAMERAENAAEGEKACKFGHTAKHLVGTGIPPAEAERAIRAQAGGIINDSGFPSGPFWGARDGWRPDGRAPCVSDRKRPGQRWQVLPPWEVRY